MTTTFKTSIQCAAILAVFAAGSLAQNFPFAGVVNSDKVNIRAGAGENYYPVIQLDRGAIVMVHENLYGWYKVTAPADSFCYVSKEFVKIDAGGQTGSIIGQSVRVRAPSPAGPDDSYKILLRLNDGDKVRVLGEAGAFYKIAPPPEARLYVKKEMIDVATPEQIAAAKNAQPATPEAPAAPVVKPEAPATPVVEKPAVPETPAVPEAPAAPEKPMKATQVAVVTPEAPAAPETPAAPEKPAVETPAAPEAPAKPETPIPAVPEQPGVVSGPHPKLTDLEARYSEMEKLPLEKQSLAALQMDYEHLSTSEDLSPEDKRLIKARVELLKNRQKLQATLAEIDAVKKQMAAADQQRADADAKKPKQYIAVGRLAASTLYTGDKLPLLYRLVDQLSGLTVAYVQPVKPDMDLTPILNQYVGVVGDKEYDPALKLNIIKAKDVDALAPTGSP